MIEGGEYVAPLLTLSAHEIPLVHFLRWVSDEAGVSVIAESKLDDRLVSVDVVDVPVDQLLGSVARRFGVEVTRTGNVFFLGAVRPEDRGTLVRKVHRLSAEELDSAIGTLLSENGRAVALSDGVVIVGDTVEVLAKVTELLDGIEAAPLDSWIVQFHIVSITESAERTLGLDLVPTLELSATLAAASAGDVSNVASLAAGLDGILRAEATTEGLAILARPMFLMIDGVTSRHSNASTVPVFKRAVSDQGTVTTEEVEFIDIGLVVQVGLREVGSGRAMLDIEIDLKSLTGFIEDAPTSRGQEYNTTAVVQSGGVYLVGEMVRSDNRRTIEGILQTTEGTETESQTVQVWVRAYRIEGAVRCVPQDDLTGVAAGHSAPDRASLEDWQRMAIERGTGYLDDDGFHWVDE